MKIAYIGHHGRKCYEYNLFSKIACEKFIFIDTDFGQYPQNTPPHIEYGKVDYSENIFLNRFFHSTASHITYKNFEKYLEDVDIIIVLEVFSSLAYQFTKYAKKNNKKVISYVYELIPEHLIYKIPPYCAYKNYVIKNVDSCITVSNTAKNHLLKLGMQNFKIQTIYPGVDTKIFRIKENIIPYEKSIVFVGKLEKHKGIDIFIDIIPELTQKYSDLKILIIGEGSYSQEVETLQKKYADHIQYIKNIQNDLLADILQKYKIYFFPIRDSYKFGVFKIGSEQFGFSVVEALACGLQIVTTDCGAIPEIVGKNASISPQNDIQNLKKSLSSLLDKKLEKNIQGSNFASIEYDTNIQAKKISNFLYFILQNYE